MRLVPTLVVSFALIASAQQASATLHDASCVSASGDAHVKLVLKPHVEDGPMFSRRRALKVVSIEFDMKEFLKLGYNGTGFGESQLVQNSYQPMPEISDSSKPFVDEQVVTAAGFGGIYALRYVRVGKSIQAAKLTVLMPEAGLKLIDQPLTCTTPIRRADFR